MLEPRQIVLHCPCGNAKVLAKGLCATCYTLKRQDEEYFGGHREEVFKRDDFRCRVPGCTTTKRGKRSIAVHHREPGNSDPGKMLTCEGHPDALRARRLAGVPAGALERTAPGRAGATLAPVQGERTRAQNAAAFHGGRAGKQEWVRPCWP